MAPKDIYSIDYEKSNLVSPIQGQILAQYQLLAKQLNTLASEIKQLNETNAAITRAASSKESDDSAGSATQLLENLRNLEMKISLVYTLFKGAVYSLFLDNELDNLQDARNVEEDVEEDIAETLQDDLSTVET